MIKCSNKKLQYIFALISSFLFFYHWVRLEGCESLCSNIKVFFEMFIISFAIFLCSFGWGRYMYNGLTADIKYPISYDFFQCIMTTVMFFLMIFSIYMELIIAYVPKGYIRGTF